MKITMGTLAKSRYKLHQKFVSKIKLATKITN